MILQIKDTNGNWITIPAIEGDSAYDVAVKNGFEGSEEEWLASLKGSGEGGSVDLTGYATETYVTQKIAEAQLSGGEVDLSGYVTTEELVEAVDSALTDAKESGKFDGPQGEPGERGASVLRSKTYAIETGNDDTPYKFSYEHLNQTPIAGDIIIDILGFLYPVVNVDGYDAYCSKRGISVKGAAGADGKDGYTPVKGTDYWTEEDQAAIVSDVLAALPVAEEVSV